MDVFLILRSRLSFIRSHYDTCISPFESIMDAIQNEKPPYDNPPYDESGEPPFIAEWMDAETSVQVVGMACVTLLADALKLYLIELKRQLRLSFTEDENKRLKRGGYVEVFRDVLGEVFDTDWSDTGVDFMVIEQIVLARNRGQHGTDLFGLDVQHDAHTLRKHPRPIFASEQEWQDWLNAGAPSNSFFFPTIKITRDVLFSAVLQVENLATWVRGRIDDGEARPCRRAVDAGK